MPPTESRNPAPGRPDPEAAPAASPERSDAELVVRARDGERGAFEALMRRYGPRVRGLARRYLLDPDEAADAVQDTFVHAWQGLGSFRGGEEFRGWLFRICVNLARDRLRARRRHPAVPLEEVPEPELGPAADPPPDQQLDRRLLAERLERAMARLGPEHREILVLRAVEEMSYDEMAAVLRIPRGTVMSRLARARMRLRELMEEGTS